MKRTFLFLVLLGSLAACSKKNNAATEMPTSAAPTTKTPAATSAAPETPTATEAAPAPTAPAATFDISTVPVSTANLGSFPYVGGIKGYRSSSGDSVDFEFDRSYLYDGKNLIAVEGRVLRRRFNPIDSDKQASELMIRRNYENWAKSAGAVKVFSGVIPDAAVEKVGDEAAHKGGLSNYTSAEYDVYLIRQKDKEVWVQVQKPSTQYYLNVVERAAMPQQVITMKADELKKN